MAPGLKSFHEILAPGSTEHSIYLWGLDFVEFLLSVLAFCLCGSKRFRTVLNAGFSHLLVICVSLSPCCCLPLFCQVYSAKFQLVYIFMSPFRVSSRRIPLILSHCCKYCNKSVLYIQKTLFPFFNSYLRLTFFSYIVPYVFVLDLLYALSGVLALYSSEVIALFYRYAENFKIC